MRSAAMRRPTRAGSAGRTLAPSSRPASSLLLLAALFALVGLLAACSPPATEDSGEETTSNAVLLEVEGDPILTFKVWFDVGSQDDPVGKEGLAALTGALISGGATESNSYEQILEKLYPIAASYGARVDKEMTTLTGRTHSDNLDLFIDLFSDAYLEPQFDQADFDRLKANQLNAIETGLRYSDDEELGKAALEHFVFEGTRYAHPIWGTVEGLKSITLDDVKQFWARHYTRENAVVALGGGFDDALLQRFEGTLEQLPSADTQAADTQAAEAEAADPQIEPAAIDGRTVLLVEKPDADSSISFGFPLDVSRGEDDFYALWLANSWLGEHRNSSSHLYSVIRETRGMNYGDYSYIEAFPEGGRRQMPPANVARQHQLFQVWIRTLPNEQAVFALRAAIRELDRLVNEGLTEEQFQLTRSFLQKYHLHFAENTTARLGYRIDDRFYGIEGDGHLARFGEKMEQLTREQVNAAIKRHLQTDDMKIAIVTGAAEQLKAALAGSGPTPITYPTPKSDEILAEDEVIAAYPLDIAEDAISIVSIDEIFGR